MIGRRQTEFGYERISVPLPAVIAVSDSINQPRYPSLKGIMGAKSKPPDACSRRPSSGRRPVADDRARARGAPAARRAADRGGRRRRRRGDRRVSRREAAARVKALVFCEHHGGRDHARPRSASSRRPRALAARPRRVLAGSAVAALAARGRRATAPRAVFIAEDERLAAPLPQPRVDVLADARPRARASTRCSSPSRCSQPTSPRRSRSRLDAGLNWDLVDLELRDGALVGTRPALADSVWVEVGWSSPVRLGALPRRRLRPGRARRRRRSCVELAVEIDERSLARRARRSGRREAERAVDRGRRGHRRRRPRARRARGLRARRGARRRARRRRRRDARGRRRGLVPLPRRRSARPGRPSRRSSTSRSGSPARSSTRSGCRARA